MDITMDSTTDATMDGTMDNTIDSTMDSTAHRPALSSAPAVDNDSMDLIVHYNTHKTFGKIALKLSPMLYDLKVRHTLSWGLRPPRNWFDKVLVPLGTLGHDMPRGNVHHVGTYNMLAGGQRQHEGLMLRTIHVC